MPEQTTIERAFELARSGKFRLVDDLKRQLRREGFNQNQIFGPILRRQLLNAMAEARLVPKQGDIPYSHVAK